MSQITGKPCHDWQCQGLDRQGLRQQPTGSVIFAVATFTGRLLSGSAVWQALHCRLGACQSDLQTQAKNLKLATTWQDCRNV